MITSTDLRTKMPEVIASLLSGRKIDLIHRSRLIGEIKPRTYQEKPFTEKKIDQLIRSIKQLRLPRLTDNQIKARFNKHIMEKYGKNLS